MIKENVIGIDLGTTNSAVAIVEGNTPTIIPNNEGKRTTPSVVAFLKQGMGERKIGDPAKRQAITNSRYTISSIKRFMGKQYKQVTDTAKEVTYKVVQGLNDSVRVAIGENLYSPEEISAMILQKMKAAAEDYTGKEVKKAVITVPAYFNDSERQATKQAGEIAGLEVLRIINEPTAAGLAYGLDKKGKESKIVVFDLGGGTFDNSILEVGEGVFEVLSTNGDVHLGGDVFDNAIVDYVAEEFKKEENIDLRKDPTALQRLKEAAEKAKIGLSSSKQEDINLPYIAVRDDIPKHLVQSLSQSQFERLIEPHVKHIRALCEEVLKAAKLTTKDIDEVVLVGGSTRIPRIQQVAEEVFGKKPSKGVNPDEVVALGAAIQAAVLAGSMEKDVVLLDVTPLSLGIETMGGVCTRLIEANTTIPTKKSQIFSTAQDNQPSVQINVLQGERPMAKDNRSIGKFHLDGIKPAPRGMPQIEVTFDIDANGILHVSAKDKESNKEQKVRIQPSSGLEEHDIERMKKEAKANEAADRKAKEQSDKLNQADALIFRTQNQLKEYKDKLPEKNRVELKKACDELAKAYELKDLKAIDQHKETLEKLWREASAEMYKKATQAAQGKETSTESTKTQQSSSQKKPAQAASEADEVEFEEVEKR